MEITLKNGRKLSGRVDFPKGEPENPMTEEDLTAKFLDFCINCRSGTPYGMWI